MVMNRKSLSSSVGALMLALAAGTSTADRAITQETQMRTVAPHQPPMIHRVVGDCTGEARPDRVVIAGAMTAEGLKPVEAQVQLDRQLAELKSYVDTEDGHLKLMERVRAAGAMGRPGSNRYQTLPFLAMQRLEIEFPASIAVDDAFERTVSLGLDRFGSNIRVDRVNRRRNVAVRYRFSALRDELDRIHAQCRVEAVARWCATQGANLPVCTLSEQERDSRVKTQSLSLRTQRLLNEHGGVSNYHLNYPWRTEQMARIEPVGNIAVEFTGTLHLQIADMEQ